MVGRGGVWARSIKTLGAILHWCGLFARGVAALGLGYGGGAGASRGGLGKGNLGMEQGTSGFPDPELAVGFPVQTGKPRCRRLWAGSLLPSGAATASWWGVWGAGCWLEHSAMRCWDCRCHIPVPAPYLWSRWLCPETIMSCCLICPGFWRGLRLRFELEGKRLPLLFLPWETAARPGAAPCRWVPGSGLPAHLGPTPRGRAELQLGHCRATPGPALAPLPPRDARGSPMTHMLSPVSHSSSWAGDTAWDNSPRAAWSCGSSCCAWDAVVLPVQLLLTLGSWSGHEQRSW